LLLLLVEIQGQISQEQWLGFVEMEGQVKTRAAVACFSCDEKANHTRAVACSQLAEIAYKQQNSHYIIL
jgi:hypothetical protein